MTADRHGAPPDRVCSRCSDSVGVDGNSWSYAKLGDSASLDIQLCAECSKTPIQVCAACQQLPPAKGEALCTMCLSSLRQDGDPDA